MRLSNFIEVYKTPLDKNYRNVYDEYSTYDEYITFLRKFPTNRIYTYNQSVKSRKDANGIFNVQISGFDSMDLHDYNYILFYTGESTPHFAFITFVSSLNDGASTKACELTCKLDAWSNNYFALKTANPIVLSKRATYDNFQNRFYTNELLDSRIPTKKTFVKSLNPTEFRGITTPRVVLWQRILVAKNLGIASVDPQYGSKMYSVEDNLQNVGGLIPAYRVASIIDVATRRPIKCSVNVNGAPESTQAHAYTTLLNCDFDNKPYIKIAGINGTYAVENTLTYVIPRIYSLVQSFDGDNEIININIDTGTYISTGTITAEVPDPENPSVYHHIAISPGNDDFIVFSNTNKDFQAQWSHEITLPSLPVVPPRYSTYITSIMESEGIYSEYPFRYYSLIINGEEYPLIAEFEKHTQNPIKFTIDQYIDDRIYKSLRIIRNVDVDKSLKHIATSEEMPTRVDQLEEYLNFNRNQLQARYVSILTKGGISTAVGVASTLAAYALAPATAGGTLMVAGAGIGALSSAVSTASSVITEAVDQKAIKSDIANKPDLYSSNDNNALANAYFGDDIIVVYNEVDISNEIIRSLFTDIHHFGTTSPKYLSIFSRRRDVYDSVITPEELRVPINDSDREELQTALRAGMTFWHIVPYIQSNDRDTILTTMNKQVANICFSAIT